jgi:hypothetical protein
MNRRDIIKKSFAGLSIPILAKSEIQQKEQPKASSIIQIFLPGGVAHQDTWDYKINGSGEYRGPFSGIKTKIDDVFFGEILNQTAQISDKLTVIRSMTHGEAAHERGVHNMLTGYRPSPAIKYPSIGSIVSHELGDRNNLPSYILVPNQFAPENGSGYLSTKYGPFSLGGSPEDSDFKVKDLQSPKDIDANRFDRRKNILQTVDDHFSTSQNSDHLKAMQSFYDSAYQLMSNKNAVEAFDLSKEKEETKEKYGKNSAGMRLLMARRLVEAGVRMVTVNYGGWDHHSNLKNAMMSQAPFFDKAFSCLINDLEQRGLLQTTLVVVTSEFGRTPKINGTNGRDHWPRVFSTVLAGGGIKKGFSYGTSDALASEPDNNPVSPEDLTATIYSLLGIDFEKRLMTSDLRPIDIVREGSIIKDIIA